MTQTLHIQLLGDFSLRHGDAAVDFQSLPEQSLLGYLLLHRDAPSPRVSRRGRVSRCRRPAPWSPPTGRGWAGCCCESIGRTIYGSTVARTVPTPVAFTGCVANQDLVIGRGRLPPEPAAGQGWDAPLECAHLRLEWHDGQARALCSADGAAWYTVGCRAFPFDARAQVGLYAGGDIDRAIYPGAFPDGTAIRFDAFHCWELAG